MPEGTKQSNFTARHPRYAGQWSRTCAERKRTGLLDIGCAEGPGGWGYEADLPAKMGATQSPAAAAGVRQNLCKVERFDVRQLVKLLAATESIGNHNRGWPSGLNGREQVLVGDGLRHLEFIGFETEGACHPAATGLDGFDRGAGLTQKHDFAARSAKNRFVMAVAMEENVRASERVLEASGDKAVWRARGEKVGKKPDLLAQMLGAGIAGEKFEELVFEDTGATGLEKNKRQAGIDLRSHTTENLREIGAGGGKQAEIVERPAATDVPAGRFHAEAGKSEDGFGGLQRLRVVVVVPGVGPEEH